jgi:hypothetical protein
MAISTIYVSSVQIKSKDLKSIQCDRSETGVYLRENNKNGQTKIFFFYSVALKYLEIDFKNIVAFHENRCYFIILCSVYPFQKVFCLKSKKYSLIHRCRIKFPRLVCVFYKKENSERLLRLLTVTVNGSNI